MYEELSKDLERSKNFETFWQHEAEEARPVVKGKWKHGVCQTCFFDWSEVTPFANVPNFCPNCGADMR